MFFTEPNQVILRGLVRGNQEIEIIMSEEELNQRLDEVSGRLAELIEQKKIVI